MTSRGAFVNTLVGCVLFGLASCASSPSVPDNSLFRDTMPRQRLRVTGEVERVCRSTLGYAYPGGAISWQQLAGSRVWEVTTRGKHGSIVSEFEVRADRIFRSRIQSSRERRGRQIRSMSYLKQFTGMSLSGEGLLSANVDGITGATISSQAVESAALLALKLDAMVPARNE